MLILGHRVPLLLDIMNERGGGGRRRKKELCVVWRERGRDPWVAGEERRANNCFLRPCRTKIIKTVTCCEASSPTE